MSTSIPSPSTPRPLHASLQRQAASQNLNTDFSNGAFGSHTVTVHNDSSAEQQTIAQPATTHQTALQVFKACCKRTCTPGRVICLGGGVVMAGGLLALDALWLHTLGFAKAVGV